MVSSAKPAALERAFIAFAGGGAKGVSHVGALAAIEQRNYDIRGVAGTSAGAIIAALRAAGFTANDIFDEDTYASIIDKLQAIDPRIKSATSVFGIWGWKRLLVLRWSAKYWGVPILLAVLPLLPLLEHLVCLYIGGHDLLSPLCITASLILWIAILIGGALTLLGGLADTVQFREALDTLLQEKVFPTQPCRTVLMRDFGRNGRPTLKIVAANISTQKLQLFSPAATPLIPVADAVAASIGLPFIFRPKTINGQTYMDGGLVSNLPAWPFDEERELDPDAITFAVELQQDDQSHQLNRFDWLPSAIKTTLFGARELSLRMHGQNLLIVLRSNLGLMQFDLSPRMAAREIKDARLSTDAYIKRHAELQIYQSASDGMRDVILAYVKSIYGRRPKIRIAFAMADPGYKHSLRLRYTSGYGTDRDKDQLIPIDQTLIGFCYRTNFNRLEAFPLYPGFSMPDPAYQRIRSTKPHGLTWQACFPVTSLVDNSPFVIVIECSDIPLEPTIKPDLTKGLHDIVHSIWNVVKANYETGERL